MSSEVLRIRWRATVVYRSENGPIDAVWDLGELDELQGFVELGPHWDTVIEIRIVRVGHCEDADLTVEEAARL